MIQLDDLQKKIAHEPCSSRQLIMAGPGRGKTELVSRRILYLVDEGGLNPSDLLILSFSRSAVRTLSRRLRWLDSLSPGLVESLRHISIRTFDSWTYRMLRFLGHTISDCLGRGYDANIELLSQTLKDKGTKILQEKHLCGLHRIKHIIVDEVQDLSGVRSVLVLRLLKLICNSTSKDNGFTLLGDENQAIYDFAYREKRKGMTALEFLQEIRQRWKQTLIERELLYNYRCDQPVDALITKASEILKRSRAKDEDPLPALNKLMENIQATDINEALENNGSTAILCRNNGQALFQASQLLLDSQTDMAKRFKVQTAGAPARLPYWVGALLSMYTGQTPLNKSLIQSIYESLVQKGLHIPYDSGQLWDMLLHIMRVSDNSSISMEELIARLRWPDSLPDDDYEEENDLVLLTTVHQSKGQEFDHVMVLRDGVAEYVTDDCDVDEEGRIFYVAISRARSSLFCIDDDSGTQLRKHTYNRGKRERWFGLKVISGGKRNQYLHYMEIGITGDLDEHTFAETNFHGGEEEVRKLQHFIAQNASSLQGEKVLLKKNTVKDSDGRKVYYKILLDAMGEKYFLGTCTEQLSKDLLREKRHKNLKLPKEIHGLRISQVYSYISNNIERDNISEPFSRTGIWLCVSIHGIGQYEYYF